MNDAYRLRQLQHIQEALAENERHHTQDEADAAWTRAQQDQIRILGLAPVQTTLMLAA